MAYSDAANYNRVKSMQAFHVGTIIPWSGGQDTIPKGWLACTGGTLNVSNYPLLYECIGNTYGGTTDSTFGLPALNAKGIVDIFQGHYQFLRSTSATYPSGANNHPMSGLNTAPWSPNTTSTQTTDLYWSQIGGGTLTPGSGGDTGSVATTNHISTMDLVGTRVALSSDLTAVVQNIELVQGNYGTSYNVLGRKLGDAHWRSHEHSISVSGNSPSSYDIVGGVDTSCSSKWGGSPDWCGSGQSVDCRTGNSTQPSRLILTTSTEHLLCGGGNTRNTTESAGNGCTGGDMLAAASGSKKLQSALNQNFRSFSEIIGHDHGSVNVEFTSRLSAQSNFTLNTISPNNVVIDNQGGVNAATIEMSSLTPSIAMLFIIRAY